MTLKENFKFFIENQNELVSKYPGKFIIIRNKEVVRDFESESLAYQHAIKNFEEGTFLIQECLPGEDVFTQTFHSRVLA